METTCDMCEMCTPTCTMHEAPAAEAAATCDSCEACSPTCTMHEGK